MAEIVLGRLKFKWKGAWTTNTAYIVDDIVKFNANSFVCVANHTSSSTTDGWFTNDYANWQLYVPGVNSTGLWSSSTKYYVNDLATYSGSVYISTSNANLNNTPNISSSYWTLLVQGTPDSTTANVFYVDTLGNDTTGDGKTLATAWASVRKACTSVTGPATIYVKAGTYQEQLPITVPAGISIIGDSMRDTVITPKSTGLSTDASPVANNLSTMFYLSDNTLLQQLLMTGMTGFTASGSAPTDITQATIGGVYLRLNPSSPILTKSPYIKDCTANSSGGVAALVDGSVHGSGYKSMVFWAYNMVMDNGVGIWAANGARVEAVSVFTYYAYFGYTTSGGGQIRSLSGNNSYGTYGAVSAGYLSTEVPVTGTVYGNMLTFSTATLTGTFTQGEIIRQPNTATISITTSSSSGTTATVNYTGQGSAPFVAGQTVAVTGNTISGYNNTWVVLTSTTTQTTFSTSPASNLAGGSGGTIRGYASAYVTSVQTGYLYYKQQYGTFNTTNTVTGVSSTATMTPSADGGQNNYLVVLSSLSATPTTGASIQFTGDSSAYVIQSTSIATVNSVSITIVTLAQQKTATSSDGTATTVRYNFSLIRLQGHDFLYIGTGGVSATGYPNVIPGNANPANQVLNTFPGRVYYVSTDQAGNFSVGNYFAVNQATGSATLNASAFNLSGLTSLRLGAIGGQLGAQINEFSTDGTLSQNSAVKVPTQSAIVTYLSAIQPGINPYIAPATDLAVDLGTASKRFGHVYVGPGSITLGTLTLTDSSGTLQVQASGTNAPTNINSINNGTSNITVANNGNITVTSASTLALTASSSALTTALPVTISSAATSSSVSTGALIVTGGAGIGGNAYIGGNSQIAGNLTVTGTTTFNGATEYVTATNDVFTDNLIEIHAPTGGVGGTWGSSDGKDIGLRMHYYSAGDQNAALLLANDTGYLEWYNTGTENGSGDFVSASYGTIKAATFLATTSIASSSTTFNLVNTTATTLNIGGAATTISLGASSGTLTVNNPNLTLAGGLYQANAQYLYSKTSAGTQTRTFGINSSNILYIGGIDTTLSGGITFNNGTTMMTLDSSGNLVTTGNITAGPNTSNNTITINGNGTSGTATLTTNVTTGTANIFAGVTGTINIGGSGSSTVFGGTITESSSITLKENIEPITGALDAILSLVGVTYDRKNGSGKNEAGLIAEEVDKILPNLVKHREDGSAEGIQYTKLTAYLVEAIKSLKAEIDELKGNK